MTTIAFQDGKVVMRDNKVGTEQECCCIFCRCDDCPENYDFSVTFYGVKNGPLTFTHPYVSLGGNASLALCDDYANATVFNLQLGVDEAVPGGFTTVASVVCVVACGEGSNVPGGEWYISVAVTVKDNNDVEFNATFEGLTARCDENGLAIIDTNDLTQNGCTDGSTGNPATPCPVRAVLSIGIQ